MTTQFGIQRNATGEMFAGLVGLTDVAWTRDRGEMYRLTRRQCEKVIERLRREGSAERLSIVALYS